MREIKARVWCESRKEMLQVQKMSFKTGMIMPYGWNTQYKDIFSEPMLCTGLKDANGVEIYEGDIIKALYRNYDCEGKREEYFKKFVVAELKGCFMFSSWNAHEFFNKFMYIEVCGNIYENSIT